MSKREDPRESLMWEKELLVTSDELKAYASNYPPMGVYIPRGRVKVPRLKSRRIPQIAQSARGKRNSPNLLMIRPGSQNQASNRLPPLSLYASRDVTNSDVMKTHQVPSTSSRYVIEHRANDSKPTRAKTKEVDPMMSQFIYPTNDVINNKMSEYAQTLAPTPTHLQNPLLQPVLPPPYIESHPDKSRHYMANNMTSRKDMTSLMTQDVPYPLGHHYYQHLSAIAAMAWSDCNQATEKLRRIYEETAHLSRSYDPFGFLSGGIPGYHPQILSSSPALANTASIFGSNDSALPHADLFTARYQQLAEDHKKYFNQAMSQRKTQCAAADVVQTQFGTSGMNQGNCDAKIRKKRGMTSQTGQQFAPPKEPLPGIALFDSQCRQTPMQPQLPYDVINKSASSRQKRKQCEQQGLYGNNPVTKHPRMDLPSDYRNYGLMGDNLSMTSQSCQNMTSFLPDAFLQKSHSRPPPYESVVPNLDQFGRDLLKQSTPIKNYANFSDVIKREKHDVTDASSAFAENLNLCLPSVSFSPTQPSVNEMQRNVPFLVQ